MPLIAGTTLASKDLNLEISCRNLNINNSTNFGDYSNNQNSTIITATSNFNENITITEASGYGIGYNMTAVDGTSPTTLSSNYNRFIVNGGGIPGRGLQLPGRTLTTLGRIIHIRCQDSEFGAASVVNIYASGWADGTGTSNEKIKFRGQICRYLSIYNSGFVELIRANPDADFESGSNPNWVYTNTLSYGWIATRNYGVSGVV